MGMAEMRRVDIRWTIQGRNGDKTGTLYQLHEQELMQVRESLKLRARRGDTIFIEEI